MSSDYNADHPGYCCAAARWGQSGAPAAGQIPTWWEVKKNRNKPKVCFGPLWLRRYCCSRSGPSDTAMVFYSSTGVLYLHPEEERGKKATTAASTGQGRPVLLECQPQGSGQAQSASSPPGPTKSSANSNVRSYAAGPVGSTSAPDLTAIINKAVEMAKGSIDLT